MTDAKKKSRKIPKKDAMVEVEIDETDEISQYIHKIQLQNLVLKKLSDNLELLSDNEKGNRRSKI